MTKTRIERDSDHDKLASLGLLIGFCLKMVMDTGLAAGYIAAGEACCYKGLQCYSPSPK
jgi:hypothetical protein